MCLFCVCLCCEDAKSFSTAHVLQSLNGEQPLPPETLFPFTMSAHLNLHSPLPISNPWKVTCVDENLYLDISLITCKDNYFTQNTCTLWWNRESLLRNVDKTNWDWARKQRGPCVILAGSPRTTQSFAFLKTQPRYGDTAQTTWAIWKLMNLSGKASFLLCNDCHWWQPRWNSKWMQTQPLP